MRGKKAPREKLADNEPLLPLADPIPRGRKRPGTVPPILSPEMYERIVTPPAVEEAIPDIATEMPPPPPDEQTRLTDVQAEEFQSVLFEVYARRNERCGSSRH